MNEGVFRKSAMERISSPEQLNDYIRVTNPSVFIILIAAALLLGGFLAWSWSGALTDTIQVNVLVRGDAAVCYVDEAAAARLKPGMPARLGEADGAVAGVSALPLSASALGEELSDEYILSKLAAGQWNYAVDIDVSGLPDGVYAARITLERIRPISFLWNSGEQADLND
jgi:hypothetical protein